MAKDGFKVVDSDMHVMEPHDLWQNYIDPSYKDRAPVFRGDPLSQGFANRWHVEGKVFPAHSETKARTGSLAGRHENITDRFADARAQRFDPPSQLQALEVEGIDVAVLFRTFGAHVIALDGMDGDLASAICRAFNDWLYDFCAIDRHRLRVTAQMPLQDVELAATEARRAVEDLGAVALVLPSNPVNRRPWYHPYYEPLWAAAEELNVPICFHGIHGAYQQHIGNRFLDSFVVAHAATHPMELMLDLAGVICGGVLERHPKLRVGFLEGNCSWLPWWLWRLDEEREIFGPWEAADLEYTPTEYFKRQGFASVDVDEYLGAHTVEQLGPDNLVLSTDYPHHDSAYPHALDEFLAMDGFSRETKKKILWDNCVKLYNLPS